MGRENLTKHNRETRPIFEYFFSLQNFGVTRFRWHVHVLCPFCICVRTHAMCTYLWFRLLHHPEKGDNDLLLLGG